MKILSLKSGLLSVAGAAFVALVSIAPAHSAIISIGGPQSSAGSFASLIAAPSSVEDDTTTNTGQQGFNEAQGVLLGSALAVDGGSIAAGTRVDSHMIFLNSQGNADISHYQVTWGFSGNILGVMSDSSGNLEAASNALLGAAGTTYPGGFAARGLEGGGDNYSFLGSAMTLGMHVTEPGDWIRVVTVSAVPLPAALPLYGAGIAVLGFLGWRRRKNAA